MTSMEGGGDPVNESWEDSLRKIKKELKKATEEALQSASTSGLRQPRISDTKDDDPNASFHLGVELFGQDSSVTEKNLQENLSAMERELQRLMSVAESQTDDDNEEDPALPETWREKIESLRARVVFLRSCSVARGWLDESLTASTPALAPPDLVQAAQRLMEASQALNQARAVVDAQASKLAQQHAAPAGAAAAAVTAAYQIVDAIQASLRRQKVDLLARAKSLWHHCVTLTPHSLAVRVVKNDNKEGLAVAYNVLEVLANGDHGSSALDDVFRSFCETLWTDTFQPVVESHLSGKPKTGWTFRQIEDKASNFAPSTATHSSSSMPSDNKGMVVRLEWSREDYDLPEVAMETKPETKKPDISAWKDTVAFMQRIVVFTTDHVLLNRSSLCKLVGLKLFGKPNAIPKDLNLDAMRLEACRIGNDNGMLLENLVDAMEDTCIPAFLDSNSVQTLSGMTSEIEAMVNPFLEELSDKGLLPATDDGSTTRLGAFARTFERKYVENRRRLILNEARRLLLNNDYHNTVSVGVDISRKKDGLLPDLDDGLNVFKLHKASVSDTAFKLMALTRKTMDEAVDQQPAPAESSLSLLPPMLYRAAREVLDLFRALIPVTHGHEIASVPRTAAILHNDCVYLAHNCLTLGLEYKDKFPPSEPDDARGGLLRQTCIFLDMVPLFRELAERSLGEMLDLQARQIVDLVGQRIAGLSRALRSPMPLPEWSDAEKAIDAALYHLRHLGQAWKPVLSYEIMNRSLGFVADVAFGLFLEQMTLAEEISTNAGQFVGKLFKKAMDEVGELVGGDTSGSRLWDRFSAMGRFVDMSLADIRLALSDGVFRTVTGPELTKLITASFTDSPKRRDLLHLISSRTT